MWSTSLYTNFYKSFTSIITYKKNTYNFIEPVCIDVIEPVRINAKKYVLNTEFDPDKQVTKFLLDLHGKDNINRSQVSSIAKLVVEHLLHPLLNSISHGKE